jgi:hypothetical protein
MNIAYRIYQTWCIDFAAKGSGQVLEEKYPVHGGSGPG